MFIEGHVTLVIRFIQINSNGNCHLPCNLVPFTVHFGTIYVYKGLPLLSYRHLLFLWYLPIWRAHFQKGLNSFLVEIELLAKYDKVSKKCTFWHKFQVSRMFSSEVKIISFKTVNLILFQWKIIHGNVFFKIRPNLTTFIISF